MHRLSRDLVLIWQVLHGDIPQASREKTMAAFRSGRFRVLIATDVAARGLSPSDRVLFHTARGHVSN